MKKTITLLSIIFCLNAKAQTAINEPPVSTTMEVCISGSATITIPSSQTGFYYGLSANSNLIGSPQVGTGQSLSFSTGTVTVTTVFTVAAIRQSDNQITAMVPSITVTVDNGPITAVSTHISNSVVCSGDQDVLTASGASSYTWSANAGSSTSSSVIINPTATTVYTVTGENACPTTKSNTVAVTVNPLPPLSVNSPTLCGATSSVTITASGATSYTWSDGGTSPTINPSPSTTSFYTVTGTGANSCTTTVTSTVTVLTLPTLTVTPQSYTVCPYTPITFTASGANTYTWTYGTTGTSASINVTPAHNNIYYYDVKGTDANGCTNTSYGIAYMYNTNYGLAFSATQQLYTAPPFVVQFNNSSQSLTNYTYTWLFGDGQSQQTNNGSVFHTYTYNGTYDVTLVAVDNSTGCLDTLLKAGYIYCTGGITGIKEVTGVSNQINVYPNPNNGNFIIETNSSEKQMLKIFDITGNLVSSQSIYDKTNIDASNLNVGVYNLIIINSIGVMNKRIVIER